MRNRFIFQNNLIAENDIKQFQEICKKNNIEFFEVTVIPFSSDLPKFPIDDDKENIYYGSTTFNLGLYNKLKPKGLFFDPEKFLITNYINHWKDHMLNNDASVTTLDKLINDSYDDSDQFFIRPNADDKSFEGKVMFFKDIKDWQKNLTQFDNVQPLGKMEILISQPYNISKEWRNIIIDGKIITSSLYRENFKLKKSATDIPDKMIEFVGKRIAEYTPARAFAMDVGYCGDEYYIIECGCVNSVGFYHCDIEKIIVGLANMEL